MQMRLLFMSILIFAANNTFSQSGVTFEVEKLSKPDKLLLMKSYDDICIDLILKSENVSRRQYEKLGNELKYSPLAKAHGPDSLVTFGRNAFFNGMYNAYADHRPFVLSPDMIWLLITQGFAQHVNANSEALRKHFVEFSGKQTLVMRTSDKKLPFDADAWEKIFPQFTQQIAEQTSNDIISVLTSDFSTTTSVERIASEITAMKAMEPYFEFVVMNIICGIPKITLQGTTEDWQKVLEKTQSLAKYDLKWWTKELEPLLVEFVNASKGDVNKKFWRNMFKYHSQKQYGAANMIDGWIVKFYPYDKFGRRNNLNKLEGGESLPEEIVKVDLSYIEMDGNVENEMSLELWAGFIGLEQNPHDFGLTPKISWMIKQKDEQNIGLQNAYEKKNIPRSGSRLDECLNLRVTEVPESLSKLNEIYHLRLNFKAEVFIPEWFKEMRIGILHINGEISDEEKHKIINWFPDSKVVINGEVCNELIKGWMTCKNEFPEELKNFENVWVVEINNYFYDNLFIPEWLASVSIEILALTNNIPSEDIQLLRELLPNTKIYIKNKLIE